MIKSTWLQLKSLCLEAGDGLTLFTRLPRRGILGNAASGITGFLETQFLKISAKQEAASYCATTAPPGFTPPRRLAPKPA